MLHIRTALLRLAADDPSIRSVVLPVTRQAKRWEKMPKGWTNESREKFWATLTGDSKHKVSECIKKMTDKGGIDNPGAFCAALADRVMGSDWRKGPRKKKAGWSSSAYTTPPTHSFQEGRLSVSVTPERPYTDEGFVVKGFTVWMSDAPPSGVNQGYSRYVDKRGKLQTYRGSGWESDKWKILDRMGCLFDSFRKAKGVADKFIRAYKASHSTDKSRAHLDAEKSLRDHDWAHDGRVAFNSPYNNLPDAQGKGWTVEERGDTKRWLWSDPTYHIAFAIIETEDKRNFLNGETSYLLRVQDSHGKVYQSKKPEMHLASAYYQAKKVVQALRKGDDWSRGFTQSGTRLGVQEQTPNAIDGAAARFKDHMDLTINEHYRVVYPSQVPPVMNLITGNDFIRVVKADGGLEREAVMFISRRTGNVYRAENWNKAVPNIIANVTTTGSWRSMRLAFNKYNAPEVMGQLIALLKQYDLEEPLDLMKRDKIPQVVDKAWKGREKQASRLAELRAQRQAASNRYYFTLLGSGTADTWDAMADIKKAAERLGWRGVEIHDEGR
jgi:hypothetical protein